MALNSTSVIKIVDLLGEGPIQGLVGGSRGVYLDETPILSGTKQNFEAGTVSYDFRPGERKQSFLRQARGRSSTVNSISLEIGENYSEDINTDNEVVKRNYGGGRLIRQITDLEVDSFRILFSVPRLFCTAQEGLAKGQLFNATINVAVDVQRPGKAYETKYKKTITGIALDGYQFQTPDIELQGTGPWNIRVRKITNGEDDFEVSFRDFEDIPKNTPIETGRGNQVIWDAITETTRVRTPYPYSALVGLNISTEQFSSLPTRAYHLKGRIVQIPENANARNDGSLFFKGSFDGSLKPGYTTCPVCCFYDMLTNPRYGAGDFVSKSNVSWADLYPLARYANQQVTNSDGSREARFAINTVIGSQAEAFNVLQDLASVFRGMLYWQANTIQATADHGTLGGNDVSSVHLYINSNVIDGVFNYSGTSLKTRSTSIRVRYNDPDNFYKSNFVVVEDAGLISKYGYNTKEVVAFGTTSKFQAQRLGRWMLAAEEIDGEVVTFSTGLQGAVVLPGQVFKVADEMRQGVRLSGRVSSATTTSIIADQTISLPAGNTHKLTCTLLDGSIESKTITSVSGKTINTGAFSFAPRSESIWSISSSSVVEQKFRCVSVADNGDGTYAISAVEHNDSIYAAADLGKPLEFDDITTIDERPAKPIRLGVRSEYITTGNTAKNRLTFYWSRGLNGASFAFDVRYKVGNGNYKKIRRITETTFEIDGIPAGKTVRFQVRAVGVSPIEKKSAWTTKTKVVPAPPVDEDPSDEKPKIVIPPNPANVTIHAINDNQVVLQWQIPQTTGLLEDSLKAIIKHSSKTDGTGTWAGSTILRVIKAQTNFAVLPLIKGEYLIKFQDENRRRSERARSAIINLPNPVPRFDIQVRREDQDSPPFQGSAVNCFYDSDYDGLVLDGLTTFDDVIDVDALSSFDFVGERQPLGEYFFKDVLDLGASFSVLFTRTLESRGIYPADAIDERTALLDRWDDFDGDEPNDTSASIYFRVSNEAPVDEDLALEDGDLFLQEDDTYLLNTESNTTFGEWTPMESGRYTGRQFQFKAELTSDASDQTPIVDELGYTIELETRTEISETIASGAGSKVVTFANAFYQTPNLAITAFNLNSGVYYELTSTTRSGFTITFRNASGTAVNRDFTYQAVGYGTEQT